MTRDLRVIVALTFVGHVLGVMVAMLGLATLTLQVELNAGRAWLGWLAFAIGATSSCWCYGVMADIIGAHYAERARQ